jgi:hypothetical protein
MNKGSYEKPAMHKLENVKDITFECPELVCSIILPPPPPPPGP